MEIKISYDSQLMSLMQDSPDSVFQDGNQRLIYAICDIHETDTSYIVSFRPPTSGNENEKITFDFIGPHLSITGECHPNFAVGVYPNSQPIEARVEGSLLQICLPKSGCERFR